MKRTISPTRASLPDLEHRYQFANLSLQAIQKSCGVDTSQRIRLQPRAVFAKQAHNLEFPPLVTREYHWKDVRQEWADNPGSSVNQGPPPRSSGDLSLSAL